MRSRWAGVLLAALPSACASPPCPSPVVDLSPIRSVQAENFPGLQELVNSFANRPAIAPHEAGYAAVFGIEVVRDGVTLRRLLRVALPPAQRYLTVNDRRQQLLPRQTYYHKFTTPEGDSVVRKYELTSRAATVSLHDADGALIRSSPLGVTDEAMAAGIWGVGSDSRDSQAMSSLFVANMQRLVDKEAHLQDLLFEVVDRPSLLSMVLRLGVHVECSFAPQSGNVAPWLDPAWGAATRRANFELFLNGELALGGRVLLAKPTDALLAAGGVCGAVLHCARDPERMAVLRLLALAEISASDV